MTTRHPKQSLHAKYMWNILDHKRLVAKHVQRITNALFGRAVLHDYSKFGPEEFDAYAGNLPYFEAAEYGSEEYKAACERIRPAIQHHVTTNRHHPEFVMAHEQWLPIQGYEGLYEVSDFGRVRSLDRIVGRHTQGDFAKAGQIRTPHLTPKGYARIQLSREGQGRNYMVHRLVAEAFIPNPDDLPEVNHKNGNKADNRVDNLEWITSSDNLQHAYDTGLKKPAIKYVVHCNELDITTLGTDAMAVALRKRGYTKARASGIWCCIAGAHTTHLNLTFTSYNIAEYQESSPVSGMNLIDLVEMVCDWLAASQRVSGDKVHLDIQQVRFGIDPQLMRIIENTVAFLQSPQSEE